MAVAIFIIAVALFVFVLFSAFGLLMRFQFSWMLAGSVFALFAWDMTDFRRRLQFSAIDDDTRSMEKRHLARLSLLVLAALLVVSFALFLQVKFTFEWGVFLVIVILLGMVQLINWFRRQNK